MTTFIGVDVGKFELVVFYDGQHFSFPNSAHGLASFLPGLSDINKPLVVFEATGGYEKPLQAFLQAHNIPWHRAHPNKVRSFAKAKGYQAKTDKLDAQIIASYASTMNLLPSSCDPHPEAKVLVKRREQLLADRHRERVRLDKELPLRVKHSIQSHIDWLNHELTLLEDEIRTIYQSCQQEIELLTSIPGMGEVTAWYVLALLPDIHTARTKELVALAGLAPINRDSGTKTGKRFIQGGRPLLRQALFRASLSSSRFNADLAALYSRLITRGKPCKLALTAVSRKLLIQAITVLRRQSPWLLAHA